MAAEADISIWCPSGRHLRTSTRSGSHEMTRERHPNARMPLFYDTDHILFRCWPGGTYTRWCRQGGRFMSHGFFFRQRTHLSSRACYGALHNSCARQKQRPRALVWLTGFPGRPCGTRNRRQMIGPLFSDKPSKHSSFDALGRLPLGHPKASCSNRG